MNAAGSAKRPPLAIPGRLYVAQTDPAVVELDVAAGWMAPKGILGWTREVSVVAKADLSDGLRRELSLALPHEHISVVKHPTARRAAQANPVAAVAGALGATLSARGVRVHTIGYDKVTSNFFFFSEGGSTPPLHIQGDLHEMIAPVLAYGNENDDIARHMARLIDRIVAALSGGVLSEMRVELADALPPLAPKGSITPDLDAFEKEALALTAESAKWRGGAESLASTLEAAASRKEPRVPVHLFTEATRVTRIAMDLDVGGNKIALPARTLWVVSGEITDKPPMSASSPPVGDVDEEAWGDEAPAPAAAKPTTPKPAETKPAEAKPVEARPVEAKPVEAKPAEAKPVEAKPATPKQPEVKPAEIRPATPTQPAAKPAEARPTTPKTPEVKPTTPKQPEVKRPTPAVGTPRPVVTTPSSPRPGLATPKPAPAPAPSPAAPAVAAVAAVAAASPSTASAAPVLAQRTVSLGTPMPSPVVAPVIAAPPPAAAKLEVVPSVAPANAVEPEDHDEDDDDDESEAEVAAAAQAPKEERAVKQASKAATKAAKKAAKRAAAKEANRAANAPKAKKKTEAKSEPHLVTTPASEAKSAAAKPAVVLAKTKSTRPAAPIEDEAEAPPAPKKNPNTLPIIIAIAIVVAFVIFYLLKIKK